MKEKAKAQAANIEVIGTIANRNGYGHTGESRLLRIDGRPHLLHDCWESKSGPYGHDSGFLFRPRLYELTEEMFKDAAFFFDFQDEIALEGMTWGEEFEEIFFHRHDPHELSRRRAWEVQESLWS